MALTSDDLQKAIPSLTQEQCADLLLVKPSTDIDETLTSISEISNTRVEEIQKLTDEQIANRDIEKVQGLEDQVATMQAEMQPYDSQLYDFQKDIGEKDSQLSTTVADIEKSQNQVISIQAEIEKLQNIPNQDTNLHIARLQTEINVANKLITSLQERKVELETELSNLKEGMSSLNKTRKDLQDKIDPIQHTLNAFEEIQNLSDEQVRVLRSLNMEQLLQLQGYCQVQLLHKKINSYKGSSSSLSLMKIHLLVLIQKNILSLELAKGYRIDELNKTKIFSETKEVGEDEISAYYNNLDTNGLKDLVQGLSLKEKICLLELYDLPNDQQDKRCRRVLDLEFGSRMIRMLAECTAMLLSNKRELQKLLMENKEVKDLVDVYIAQANNHILAIKGSQLQPEIKNQKLAIVYKAIAQLKGEDYKLNGKIIAKTSTADKDSWTRIKEFEKIMISSELALIDEYINYKKENLSEKSPKEEKDKLRIACQAKANLIGKDLEIIPHEDPIVKERKTETIKSKTSQSNVFERIAAYEKTILDNKETLKKENKPIIKTLIGRIFQWILGLNEDKLIQPRFTKGHGKTLVEKVSASMLKEGIFKQEKKQPQPQPQPVAPISHNDKKR